MLAAVENRNENQSFAVLLNSNAKRVDQQVEKTIRELVPPEHVYTSHSFHEADDITREIIHKGYPMVFTGGGDGTVTHFIDSARRYLETENTWHNLLTSRRNSPLNGPFQMPDIGILKLGTGNALAQVVGSTNYRADLQHYVETGFSDHIELSLIESKGRRFAFAGLGWDADILNEYRSLKERYAETRLSGAVENLGGYLAAFFLKFAPKQLGRNLRRKRVQVKITALGPASRLEREGCEREHFAPGTTLYQGPMNVAIVGTQPYYGFGFKVLPYGDRRPDRFQLRVVRQGILKTLSHLPSVWNGTYYNPEGILDFSVSAVHLSFSEPVPSQIAGDADGCVSEATYQIADDRINLLYYN